MRSSVAPVRVSPARGRRSTFATRSRLIEPTTVTEAVACDADPRRLGRLCRRSRLRGKRAQVARGTLEVLAQVEETGPERGAIRNRVDVGHVGKALQGPYQERPSARSDSSSRR